MDPSLEVGVSRRAGNLTLVCRLGCSALVAGALVYWNGVADGDVYHFLGLVLLAPIAGVVLIANSLFCLVRYHGWRSASVALIFIPVGAVGILVAVHFLPQFRM